MSRRLVTALGTSIVLAVPIIAAAPVAGANEEPYFTVAISEGKCLLSLNQANPQAKQNQQFLASPTKNRIQYFNSRIPGLEALVNELADAHTSEKTALAGGDNVGMTKSGDALTATKSKITELVTRSGMNEKDAEEIVKLANDYRKEGGPTQVSYEVEQKKIAAALTAATTALSTENQFANNNKSLPLRPARKTGPSPLAVPARPAHPPRPVGRQKPAKRYSSRAAHCISCSTPSRPCLGWLGRLSPCSKTF